LKKVITVAILLIALACMLVGCNGSPLKSGFDNCDAELILPGNTIVIGKCGGFLRLSGNWIKVNINGEWYACTDWRLTLKERVEK